MDQLTAKFQGLRWGMAVLIATVFVLGAFVVYAVITINNQEAESNRQTFRGLSIIGQDIYDNLQTIGDTLPNLPSDRISQDYYVDSLASNPAFRGLKKVAQVSGCRADTPLITLNDNISFTYVGSDGCQTYSWPFRSLVDFTYVGALVDEILVSDSLGNVLYQTDNGTFARIANVASLVVPGNISGTRPTGGGKEYDSVAPRDGSSRIQTELMGAEYLLFVQPQRLPYPETSFQPTPVQRNSNAKPLIYIIGIKKKPATLDALHDLPVATVEAILAFLATLIITLPVIKVRLIGPDDPLHASDAFLYAGSMLLIAVLLSLVVLDYTAYRALRNQMDAAAKTIATKIDSDFQTELQQDLFRIWDWRSCQINSQKCQFKVENTGYYPPYQNILGLNSVGNVVGHQLSYRDYDPEPRTLGDRTYFKASLSGALWSSSRPFQRFIIDRVRVRSIGDKLSVVAIPCAIIPYSVPDQCTDKPQGQKQGSASDPPASPGGARVIALTTAFLTFKSAVLPPFYHYAVFDNVDGGVIFHSDDSRSLLEHFYKEFSKGDELKATVAYHHTDQFDGNYLGRGIALYVQPMQSVAWSVAVFYDKEAVQSIHFEIAALTLAAMIAFMLLLVIVPLLIRHCLASEPRWELLFLREDHAYSYCGFSIALWCNTVFMLLGIWLCDFSAVVVLLAEPLFVFSMGYLGLRRDTRPYWATVFAWVALVTSQLGSLWLLMAATFDLPVSVAVASPGASGILRFLMFMLACGTGTVVWNIRHGDLQEHATRENRMPWLRKKAWLRTAHVASWAAVVVAIAVVPTTAIFEDALRDHMFTLVRYGQALLAKDYFARYEELQSDVARLSPIDFAKPDAKLIAIPANLGIYASLTQLFPSGIRLDSAKPDGSDSNWTYLEPVDTNELNTNASFGTPGTCSGERDLNLTAWISSRLPGLDDILTMLHSFAPRIAVAENCGTWTLSGKHGKVVLYVGKSPARDPHMVPMSPIDRWSPFDPFDYLSAIALIGFSIFIISAIARLASKRFFAVDIAYPTDESLPDEQDRVEKWALAVARGDKCRIHFLVRIPAGSLSKFEERLESASGKQCHLVPCVEVPDRHNEAILVLTDMHMILGSDGELDRLLQLLETRKSLCLPTVVTSCIYPVEAITHPHEYPDFNDRTLTPDPVKVARWLSILASASLHYWPASPLQKRGADMLKSETQAFPDMKKIDEEIRPLIEQNKKLTRGEIVELVRQHARSFYTSLWRLCSRRERVLLLRIAQGYLVNPANSGELTRLLERGMLRRDPVIRLPNMSIKRFITAVEPPERMQEWLGDTKKSAWSAVRFPLIALILLLSGAVAFMGKETSDYVIALLGTATTLPPLLFRMFGSGLMPVKAGD